MLDPTQVDVDPILESEPLIKEAAELWGAKQGLITLVIQARVNAIGKRIMESCPPEEVMVLRQSLVELGALITDFEKYRGEAARLGKGKEKEEVAPPPVEGAESSLS